MVASILFLSLKTLAQQGELKGYVEDKTTLLPLHGAHIQNHTTRKLVISDPDGTFILPVSIGDSVVISYTGFYTASFIIDGPSIQTRQFYSLEPSELSLQDVVITPVPEYWDFKKELLNTDPVDSSIKIDVPKVGKYTFYDPRTAPLDGEKDAPMFSIPIDLEKLSKKGREKKKFEKVLQKEQKWKEAHLKFNRDLVAQLTDLEGDELTNFISFCDFSVDHILDTHVLELKEEILALLSEFKSKGSFDDRYPPGA